MHVRRSLIHVFRTMTGWVICLSLAITVPFYFRQTSWSEWANPYWLLLQQHDAIRQTGIPSVFVHSDPSGVAYPHHVFYAGALIAVLAYLAFVLSPWLIFCLTLAAGFVLIWFGSFWICRAVSGSRNVAHFCATCIAFSPYVITNVYGRGAWAEHMGSGLAIYFLGSVFGHRKIGGVREWLIPAIALALLLGTHNISVLLTLLLAIPIGLLTVRGRILSTTAFRSRVLGSLLGVGLASAFFLPNLYYASATRIANWRISGSAAAFDNFRVIFSPILYFPREQQLSNIAVYGQSVDVRLFAQTNVLLFLSVIVLLVRSLVEKDRLLSRARIAFLLILIFAILLLMTNNEWWASDLGLLYIVQFPYRLHPYLVLIVGMLFSSLVPVKDTDPRRLERILMAITLLWTITIGVFQVATAVRSTPPGFEFADRTQIEVGRLPPVFREGTAPPLQFRFFSKDGAPAPNGARLYFGRDGHLLTTEKAVFRIKLVHFSGKPRSLVTVGSNAHATAVGIGKNNAGCHLLIDRWGEPPELRSIECFESRDVRVSFTRSIGLISIDIGGHGFSIARVKGADGAFSFDKPVADFSTVTQGTHNEVNLLSHYTISAPHPTGQFETNVVATPFATIEGASAVEKNSEGFFNVSVRAQAIQWKSSYPTAQVLGLFITALSLIILALLLGREGLRAIAGAIRARGGT